MSVKPVAMIFDVDGTLSDTERDGHRPAFNQAFAEAELEWEWSIAEYGCLLRVTGGQERMKHYFADNPINNNISNIDDFIAGLHKRKNQVYNDIVRDGGIPLRPGVERLIREAMAEGIRLAIATTTTRSNVIALLEANLGGESLDWFEVIATADEVPDKKPSPAVYNYVLDKLQLTAADCLALEDSQNGLRSAHAAQLPTLVTINGYTENDDLAAAELIIDQFGEPNAAMSSLGGQWSNRIPADTRFIDVSVLRQLFTV